MEKRTRHRLDLWRNRPDSFYLYRLAVCITGGAITEMGIVS
jgi:hypothetical protein